MNNPSHDGSDIDYLSDLSEKDKPWDIHKNQSRSVASRYDQGGYENYSKRIWECSQSLAFALRPDEEGTVHFKLHGARFCRVRWCPVCQWRRSMMWRSRFFKAIPRVLEDYPKARFIFLTLTMKNCELGDLRGTLERMNKAWKLLTLRKGFPAIGWVKSVEVTRGADGTAHPHLHCLLIVKPSYFTTGYWSHATWTAQWKDCLKIEYQPIVNVKVVKDNKTDYNKVPEEVLQVQSGTLSTQVPQDIVKGLLETLKYSVKPSDLEADADWLIELTKQMHKTRAIGLGGILKQYLSEKEPEDLIHGEDEEEDEVLEEDTKIIFDWAEVARRYAKSK